MSTKRTCVPDFSTANKLYVNAIVTFYKVLNGEKTAELADVYAGLTGDAKLRNPQTLDSFGKFKVPVYIAEPVIMTVTGLDNVEDHDTGVVASTTITEAMGIVIENVSNKTFDLIINSPYAFEIIAINTKSTAGSCVATGKINGTDLGGGPNAISTSLVEIGHEADNIVDVGNTFSIEITENIGCENASITIEFARR